LIAIQLFAVDRDLAIRAAPIIFLVFERYQILLGVAGLLCAAGWRFVSGSTRVNVVFAFLAVAAIAAAVQPIAITKPMEQLRLSGRTDSPEFKKLHGESMAVYSGEALVLLLGGFALPWAMRTKS
jgi:hypothetical protein